MEPGLFDLVVIDEATQCTLTNLLPLLYRGKNIAVIGDEHQLSAISNVSALEEAEIAKKYDVKEWMKVWAFNVGIAIEINNVFIGPLVKKKWGRVIHVSSIAAKYSDPNINKIAYSASKAYLNHYLEGVSKITAKSNVIFSGIMPGPILTEGKFWEKEMKKNPSKVKKYIEKNHAIKRFAKVSEICPFVLLLASEHSSYNAGTIIPIDGGKL